MNLKTTRWVIFSWVFGTQLALAHGDHPQKSERMKPFKVIQALRDHYYRSLSEVEKDSGLVVSGVITSDVTTRYQPLEYEYIETETERVFLQRYAKIVVTDAAVAVTEVYKGEEALAGKSIMVRQMGGDTGAEIVKFGDDIVLQPGDEVLLYLRAVSNGTKAGDPLYRIVGVNDGHFTIGVNNSVGRPVGYKGSVTGPDSLATLRAN